MGCKIEKHHKKLVFHGCVRTEYGSLSQKREFLPADFGMEYDKREKCNPLHTLLYTARPK
jgi:hypothetical protein